MCNLTIGENHIKNNIIIFEYLVCVTIATTIVFSVCWIDLNNMYLNILFINLPYLGLLLVDISLLILNARVFFKAFFIGISKQKILFSILLVYVIYEFINIIYGMKYGQYEHIIHKVLIIAKCLFLLVNVIIFVNYTSIAITDKKRSIFFSIGITSYIITIFSIIKYFTGHFINLTHSTPYKDYNVFACTLLFSTVVMVFYIFKYYEKKKKILLLLSTIVINFAVIYCSGSRRGVVLIYVTGIVFFIYYLFVDNEYPFNIKKIVSGMLLVTICSSLVYIEYLSFSKYVEVYPVMQIEEAIKEGEEKNIDVNVDEIDLAGSGETRIEQRYGTINIKEGFNSRETIWQIAFNEIKSLPLKQLLFGKGSGYNIALYQKNENMKLLNIEEGTNCDPHNIILNDILEGGIIKIVILLLLILDVLFIIWRQFKNNNKNEVIMIFTLGVLLISDVMLSARWGMLGKDSFWLLLCIIYLAFTENDKLKKKELLYK